MHKRLLQILPWILGFCLAVGAILGLIYMFVDRVLMPPEQLRMAAGRDGGGYHALATRYKNILAWDDIELEVVETAGSKENAKLLEDGEVDVALLQGGIPVSEEANIQALAAVFLEPFFILHKNAAPKAGDPSQWSELTVAAGEPGSGTRAAVRAIVRSLDIPLDESQLLPMGGAEAAEALIDDKVDVAIFVAPLTAPYLKDILTHPDIVIDTLRDSEALARNLPYVRMVDIPPAGIDFPNRLPPERVPLTAMIATLAAQQDLHPALVNRLIRAAERIHSGPNILSLDMQFPMAEGTELPMNSQAAEALTNGPSPLEDYVPFWMSAQIRKMAIVVVPLLLLLVPVARAFPGLFAWRMRTRVYRHYRDLLAVETALQKDGIDAAETRDLQSKLDDIDRNLEKLNVPLRYRELAYGLRVHVDLVRRRLRERLGPKA